MYCGAEIGYDAGIRIDQWKSSVSSELHRSLDALSSDYRWKPEDIMKRIPESPCPPSSSVLANESISVDRALRLCTRCVRSFD